MKDIQFTVSKDQQKQFLNDHANNGKQHIAFLVLLLVSGTHGNRWYKNYDNHKN